MIEQNYKIILVTGAGGYIGTVLIPFLLKEGYKVRAIDRFFFGEDLLKTEENLEIIKEDCRFLEPRHFEDVEAVIDLAAISNDPSGEFFTKATTEINYKTRFRNATLAKEVGVPRYVLPSSCSIYGNCSSDMVDETSEPNPITVYAKANLMAEKAILPLKSRNFCVIILRQATVFGLSPRMRFDLAINGMTYGAWKNRKLPLMRDGKQWRPMIHIHDICLAIKFMISVASASGINGEIFNVGSTKSNYQLADLGEIVANAVGPDVILDWYGNTDKRSYRVSFDKIQSLGFFTTKDVTDGVAEILEKLEQGLLKKSIKTMTLEWYQELVKWNDIISKVKKRGGIIDL